MEFDPLGSKKSENLEGFGSCFSKQLLVDVESCRCRFITDLPPALISEILEFLEPKELSVVSCVSSVLNRLASENRVWKEAYCERWGLPVAAPQPSPGMDARSWKELFVEREFQSGSFLGRYRVEALYGHTEAVRTVCLLATAKLIFSSGYDSVVRMWNVDGGYLIASSHPLKCTVRAIAADTKLLIAGGTNGFIQGWRAVDGMPHLFNLRGLEEDSMGFRLWEHEGPITSLAMDSAKIYSGSWDMSVRVWDRASLKCMQIFRHSDWVWALVPHEYTIVSTSGSDVYIWNATSGDLLTVISNAHAGNTYALARCRSGSFIFTGGEDGVIHMFEIVNHGPRISYSKVATWSPHTSPVYSLAFEFPWLVSASSDGKLSLVDVRKLIRTRRQSLRKVASRTKDAADSGVIKPPQRMLHGFSPNLFSVDIGADRIICGGEGGTVRMWDFSEALEIERRALALRAIRMENRMQRQKLQLEMGTKGGRADHCSLAAKLIPVHRERQGVCQSKRGMSGKMRA